MGLLGLTSCRLVGGLESRVATIEEFLGQLSSRVTMMESGLGNERNVNPTSFSGGVVPEVQDPTDGIGTVVFTEEEYSGFFGVHTYDAFVSRTGEVDQTHRADIQHSIHSTGRPYHLQCFKAHHSNRNSGLSQRHSLEKPYCPPVPCSIPKANNPDR